MSFESVVSFGFSSVVEDALLRHEKTPSVKRREDDDANVTIQVAEFRCSGVVAAQD